MTLVNPFRKTLCPYCFERFALADCEIVASISNGSINAGDVLEARPQGWRRTLQRVWVKPLTGKRYAQYLACRRCPHCSKLLPRNIEYMDNQIIGMVGGTFASKSHYIASLIKQIEREGVLDGFGCTVFRPISDEVSNKYVNDYYAPVYQRQEQISPNQPTRPDELIEPLIYVLVFRRKRAWPRLKRVNLILFDTAGEDMKDMKKVAQVSRYILNASGLIFLVDPLTIPGIQQQIPFHLRQAITGPEGFRVLASIIEVLQTHHNVLPGSPLNLPIAIALAKSDLLRYVGEGLGSEPIFLTRPNYADGYQALNLPTINEEVRELIRRYDGTALLKDSADFAKANFCAVSATGCSQDQNGKFPLVQPTRCADPLIWLLVQLGVIES